LLENSFFNNKKSFILPNNDLLTFIWEEKVSNAEMSTPSTEESGCHLENDDLLSFGLFFLGELSIYDVDVNIFSL